MDHLLLHELAVDFSTHLDRILLQSALGAVLGAPGSRLHLCEWFTGYETVHEAAVRTPLGLADSTQKHHLENVVLVLGLGARQFVLWEHQKIALLHNEIEPLLIHVHLVLHRLETLHSGDDLVLNELQSGVHLLLSQ